MKKLGKTLTTILITFFLTLLLTISLMLVLVKRYDFPLEKLLKINSIIEADYVGEYDKALAEKNAINALIKSTGDKYAAYYDEQIAEETLDLIDGYYVGIGIEVFANIEKNMIEIVSAYEDSPADKAGIRSGDLILSIDDRKYTAEQMADAVLHMKGVSSKKLLDDEINIVIQRGNEELNFCLKREKVNIYKVKSQIIDDICYIRYSGFTKNSVLEVSSILNSLDDKKVNGIIIDVRNNPGGEFNSAVKMCDLFLEDGMIMYTMDKSGEKTVYTAKEGSTKLPVAIIVNGSSASAAEIFAGSLQARGRAIVVGEKTYGKGVSQTIRYLNPLDKSSGALKITTCKNYTPDGKWIDDSIIPDIQTDVPEKTDDITKDTAFIMAVRSLKR